MFNNAGIASSFRRFLRDDLRDFNRVMAVNLFGVITGTQRAGRHMAAHGGGSIINTSSIGGLTGGGPPISYRTSKAAVAQFTRMVATDVAEYGIRVNCIAPGHIATGITNYDLGPTIELDQPLQRRGTSHDVAEAVLFLASERSAQITGIVVPVDGGTVAGRPVRQMTAVQASTEDAGTGVTATSWRRRSSARPTSRTNLRRPGSPLPSRTRLCRRPGTHRPRRPRGVARHG